MASNSLTKQSQVLDAHSTLGDRPNINDGLDSTQLKARYDRDVNRNKDYMNDTLTEELESETASNSGASKVGVETIADLTGNDVQALLENIRDVLKSVADGSSGADFVKITSISGVTGSDIQAALESLKGLIDLIYTKAELDGGQLDNRYFTESELESQVDGSSGMDIIGMTSVDGVMNTPQQSLEYLKARLDAIITSEPTLNLFSVLDYDLVGDGVTNDATALNILLTLIGSNEATIVFPALTTGEAVYLIGTNVAFPSNVSVMFNNGAKLKIDNTYTLTSNNAKLISGLHQIFDVSLGGSVSGQWETEFITPQFYGAKLDGITDDTTAFNNTVNNMDKQVLKVPRTDAGMYIAGTITLKAQIVYDFDHTVITYGGTGTAVIIEPLINNIKGLYVLKENVNYNDSSIGILMQGFRRGNAEISAAKFTTGIKLLATSVSGNSYFGYNEFNMQASLCKIGLHLETQGDGWITSCAFHNFTNGDTELVDSIGIKAVKGGGALNTVKFYNSIIEKQGTAVELDATGRGMSFIEPYMESNDQHIVTKIGTEQINIIGGFCTSPTRFIDPDDIADSTTEVTVLDPNRKADYIFYENGIYEGKVQTFQNLCLNSNFEYWDTEPLHWNMSNDEITQNTSEAENGTYTTALTNTGGSAAYMNYDTITTEDYMGRVVTVMAKIKATEASKFGVRLRDSVLGTSSVAFHSGSGDYETVSISILTDSAATFFRPEVYVAGNAAVGYVDWVMCVVGENIPFHEPRPFNNIDNRLANQATSVASDVTELKADFNALLLKLKNSGLMTDD